MQSKNKVTPWLCIPTPRNQYHCKESTSYTLQVLGYSLDKNFKVWVTTARSNQGRTIRFHTYIPQFTNIPTKFRDVAWTKLYRSGSLWQCQRSDQDHMTLHTKHSSTNVPTEYQRSIPSSSEHYTNVKSRSYHCTPTTPICKPCSQDIDQARFYLLPSQMLWVKTTPES